MNGKSCRRNLLATLAVLIAFAFTGSAVFAEDVPLLPVAPVSGGGGSGTPVKKAAPKRTVTQSSDSPAYQAAIKAAEEKRIPAFSGVGIIDEVRPDSFIVEDVYLKVKAGCVFRLSATTSIPRSAFKKGTKVGFIADKDNLLVEMWLLKK